MLILHLEVSVRSAPDATGQRLPFVPAGVVESLRRTDGSTTMGESGRSIRKPASPTKALLQNRSPNSSSADRSTRPPTGRLGERHWAVRVDFDAPKRLCYTFRLPFERSPMASMDLVLYEEEIHLLEEVLQRLRHDSQRASGVPDRQERPADGVRRRGRELRHHVPGVADRG